jgi:hypothetical protein
VNHLTGDLSIARFVRRTCFIHSNSSALVQRKASNFLTSVFQRE